MRSLYGRLVEVNHKIMTSEIASGNAYYILGKAYWWYNPISDEFIITKHMIDLKYPEANNLLLVAVCKDGDIHSQENHTLL